MEVDLNRSKLFAGLKLGLNLDLNKETSVLYLGASHGYTVKFLSEKVFTVFAVEKSAEVAKSLVQIKTSNIIPILEDAYFPEKYKHRVGKIDLLFQDVAQRDQVLIFKRNFEMFNCDVGVLCLKIKAVDSTASNESVVEKTREELEKFCKIKQEVDISEYEKDHVLFLVKK